MTKKNKRTHLLIRDLRVLMIYNFGHSQNAGGLPNNQFPAFEGLATLSFRHDASRIFCNVSNIPLFGRPQNYDPPLDVCVMIYNIGGVKGSGV